MKRFVAVVCMLVSALVLSEAARARRDEKYTTKYDNLNIDEILASDRLVDNYVKCLLDKGRCSPDGAELKARLPDALQTDCTKCSDKQKENADKIIRFMYRNKPGDWKLLQEKYDPENNYYKKYEDKLKDITA